MVGNSDQLQPSASTPDSASLSYQGSVYNYVGIAHYDYGSFYHYEDSVGNYVEINTSATIPPTDTSRTPTPSTPFEQLTTNAELSLNNAIQQATGAYDPNLFNTGRPASIRDVLSGTDWMSLLNPGNSSPGRFNDSQPSAVSQILSGTYADSVLQKQFSGQGLVTGSFVSPTAPNDYLFNPNSKSLVEAMLLASHSPNTELLQAQSLQLGASMAPIIGSVSTWMNPDSGWFSKGIAAAGALPMVWEIAGSLTELSSLSAEVDAAAGALGSELESSVSDVAAEAGGQRTTIAVEDLGGIGTTTSRRSFRTLLTSIIEEPSHPLHSLLNAEGRLTTSTARGMNVLVWFEDPSIIEAGHYASAKGLAGTADRLIVMSAYENRLLSATLESASKGGWMLAAGKVLAVGNPPVPVDFRTAIALVANGLLDAEIFANAPFVTY